MSERIVGSIKRHGCSVDIRIGFLILLAVWLMRLCGYVASIIFVIVKVIANRGKGYCKSGQLGYYKSGQELLQIGAGITNRGRFITNRGRYYKSGQVLRIGADLLQIGAGITNRGRYYKSGQIYYKSGQVLQIGAGITNRGRYYKSGQLLQIGAEHVHPC